MVKRYSPVVEKDYDLWDDEYTYSASMEKSSEGEYVSLETYNKLLRENNKLKKTITRYKRRMVIMEML